MGKEKGIIISKESLTAFFQIFSRVFNIYVRADNGSDRIRVKF